MALMLVRLTVKSFDKWQHGYQQIDHVSQAYGCTKKDILRDAQDPNSVLVMLEFETEALAHEYMEDDEIVVAMRAGNLSRCARIEYFEEREH